MATITISIPDDVVSRVLDAFDETYKGRIRLEDGQPVEQYTKVQWAKRHIIRYVRQIVQQHEIRMASQAIEEMPGIE